MNGLNDLARPCVRRGLCSLAFPSAPLLYHGLFTRQTVAIGLVLIPFYSAATALGARYFALAGQRYYRRAALATLAAIGVATLIASLRNYLKG